MPLSPDASAVERLHAAHDQILDQLSHVIVGQREVIEELLISLFSRGHCLLEGVPGLAKTLLISTLARSLDLSFSRIQFTPDLMPADIIGTDVLEEDKATGTRQPRFLEGPLFANIVLADEINRTPPKTQAALLEAMQERQVSVGRVRHEFEIARRTTGLPQEDAQPVLSAADILALQRSVREVPISDHLVRYALAVVRQTRRGEPGVPEFVSDQLVWGAGPRAVQFLIVGAKARALLQGRSHVTVEDLQALAPPVLRHRVVVGFAAESEGVTPDAIIRRLVEITPAREDDLTRDARFQTIFAS